MSSKGYDPTFLGVNIPLPTFTDALENDVLKKSTFTDSVWTEYIHYSLATNKELRQPICVALNIDQKLIQSVKRGGWDEDERVGSEYQLNNDYYRNNDWDRGHLARRSAAAWGVTEQDARDASDGTSLRANRLPRPCT